MSIQCNFGVCLSAGHAEAILHVAFSSDGKNLVSGSGDTTVRIWDVLTATPKSTLRGHTNWVMAVAFSPDGKKIASGGMEGSVIIWDVATGKQIGKTLKGFFLSFSQKKLTRAQTH